MHDGGGNTIIQMDVSFGVELWLQGIGKEEKLGLDVRCNYVLAIGWFRCESADGVIHRESFITSQYQCAIRRELRPRVVFQLGKDGRKTREVVLWWALQILGHCEVLQRSLHGIGTSPMVILRWIVEETFAARTKLRRVSENRIMS